MIPLIKALLASVTILSLACFLAIISEWCAGQVLLPSKAKHFIVFWAWIVFVVLLPTFILFGCSGIVEYEGIVKGSGSVSRNAEQPGGVTTPPPHFSGGLK